MKQYLNLKTLIMAVLTVIMAVALCLYISSTGSLPAADNAVAYNDGSYTASAQGFGGNVTVSVTVLGGKVTNVTIDAPDETPTLGGAAAEALAEQLTSAGSLSGVDAVSGSTVTSNAVFAAMEDCLAQAAQ